MAISFGIFGVLRASEIPLDLIRLHVYGVLGVSFAVSWY